jgi:hypothetical protein
MHWNSIKPAQLRTAAIRAVCNQIIYQNYGTLKRKFRNSLFNSLLFIDFDGTNVVRTVVSYTGHHEVIYVVGQNGWNLQKMAHHLNLTARKYKMTIFSTITNSKAMLGNHIQRVQIVINGKIMEEVTDFIYLAFRISEYKVI